MKGEAGSQREAKAGGPGRDWALLYGCWRGSEQESHDLICIVKGSLGLPVEKWLWDPRAETRGNASGI